MKNINIPGKMMLIFITLILALVSIVGCGPANTIGGLVSVNGKVMFEDQPLVGATITFSPKNHQQGNRAAVGHTNEKGEFTLLTLGQKGVLPNDYLVSIVKNADAEVFSNQDRAEQMKQTKRPMSKPQKIVSVIPGKYNEGKTSGIEYCVEENGLKNIVIELVTVSR